MPTRQKLTSTEIIEKQMLTMAETLKVLSELGFVNITENMIRKYLTLGLLERPQMGPPGRLRTHAKYESYFSKRQLLSIVDIRLRMGRGYTINDLIKQQVRAAQILLSWKKHRHEMEVLVFKSEAYFRECLHKLRTDNKEGEKSVEKILKIIEMKKRADKRMDEEVLGGSLDPKITKTIDAILDRKFKDDDLYI